jgi:hypothetical protein
MKQRGTVSHPIREAVMINSFSTPHNRIRTLILLIIGALATIAASVAGLSNNPPGVLLAFLAATAFVLVFVHTWRTSIPFVRLLYTSVLGFFAFGLLHNMFEAIATNIGGTGLQQNLLNGAGVFFFIITILFCPPGFLIGVIGAVFMFIRNRHQPKSVPPTTS